MSSSVSISITSEYGFSTRRVFGRIVSRSADSERRPEKMITGISGGVDTTTSRPEPRRSRRSMIAAAGRCVLIASRPSSAVSAVTTVYCRICRNFTSGWRTALIVFDDENDG